VWSTVESIFQRQAQPTSPSAQTNVGALTTGLMAWNFSKVLNTDTAPCVNGTPSTSIEIAVRRTQGEDIRAFYRKLRD